MAVLAARIRRIENRLQVRRQQRRHPEVVYSSPLYFVREQLGFRPDDWQQDVLESDAKRLLLLCARQSGKSTVVAAIALHQALFFAGSLILLLSRSLRQSGELFRKVTDFLALLPIRPSLEEDNLLSVKFANGSRIVSLPGDEETVRGFSGAKLIVIDEAARVPDSLYFSLRPMLAVSDGKLMCLTTPWGKRGFFYQAWTEGQHWQKVRITAAQCPRISPEFLAEEKGSMPASWYASEYECEFVDTIDQVFSHADVMGALSDEVAPLFAVSLLLSHSAIDRSITPLGGIQ